MPIAVLRRHHVAAGGIDVERGAQRHAAFDQRIDIGIPFLAARIDGLRGQPCDPAEARLFVEIIVIFGVKGERAVFQQAFEMAVEMGDPVQPEIDSFGGGHFGHAGLREVGDGAHQLRLRLVQRSFQHIGSGGVEELDPPIPLSFGPADPFAGLGGRVGRAARPFIAEHRIGNQPRRSDRVGHAAGGVGQIGLVRTEIEADPAHRGHSMGQPQLVAIGRLVGLGRIAIVAMRIDEAGEDIHATRLDHLAGRAADIGRRAPGIEGGDAVFLDENVDRPCGRRAAAFDDGGTCDQKAREGPFAFAGRSVGHGIHLLRG